MQVVYISDRFSWTSQQLLGLKTVTAASSALGQFLLFPVLVQCLQVSLPVIGVMTVVSRVSHYLILALADQDYLLYISAAANCLQVGIEIGISGKDHLFLGHIFTYKP